MSLVTTRAVLLRSFPYSETSRVMRFYTESLGTVGVMARGVRTGSGKSGSGLDVFAEIILTLHIKSTRELQTLKEFTVTRGRRSLGVDVRRLGGASVLAEVVLKHAGEDSNPPLFEALSDGLDRLGDAPPDRMVTTLLREGWCLVSALGYRPVAEVCVECGLAPGDELTRFDFSAGGIRCAGCSGVETGPRLGPRARAQLAALLDNTELPEVERPRVHLRLLGDFITYHISGGRPLVSLKVLAALLDDPAAAPSREVGGAPSVGGTGA
jgi:DNA repair protein RecO (recombination protein O)